jgi:hypothetical protein
MASTLAAGVSSKTHAEPFFAQLIVQGVTFQVESPNDSSINQVLVRASTSEESLGQMQTEADGTITGVETEDLNDDGFPEIYVYVTSAGSGSYGSLIAFASSGNKSLSPIFLPSLEDQPELSRGYMGHDQFAIGEGTFMRRFPVYMEGDTNAAPTGDTRQIQYKLEPGEASWILRQDRVVDVPSKLSRHLPGG